MLPEGKAPKNSGQLGQLGQLYNFPMKEGILRGSCNAERRADCAADIENGRYSMVGRKQSWLKM